MPTYTMTGPDGKTYSIDGPPGASQADVQAQMQAHYGAHMQTQQAAQQQPQAPPQPKGGDIGGSLYAGIRGFEDMATFGQGDKVAALASTLTEQVGHMVGLDSAGIIKAPESYSQNYADIQNTAGQEAAAHPVANIAGEVAGVLPGGALAGRALQAAGRAVPLVGRVASALEPVANQPVRNVIKSAVTNAGIGGGTALANGQSLPQAGQTAAITGIAGPIVGKVATFALDKLAPVAQRAYMVLADKLGMSAPDLQTAIQNYQRVSGGAMPTVAGLANLKAQGRLAELAKTNSTIGEAANRATASLSQRPMTPEQLDLVKVATGAGPQTAADLWTLRKSNMDKSMAQIRDLPIPYSKKTAALLSDARVNHALNPESRELGDDSTAAKISQYIADGHSGSHLTFDDIDNIREALRNRQDVFDNPESNNHSRPVAREYGQLADMVEKTGSAIDSRYGDALKQYRLDSDYLNGFKHTAPVQVGGRGLLEGQAPAGSQTAIALTRPRGQAGSAHGSILSESQKATEAIAPARVQPQGAFTAHNAAQAGMAAASSPGGVGMVYHIMRAVPGMHLPEPVQQKVAQMLFDPRSTTQAVNVLRRAGVDAQTIRRMGAAAGGLVSQRVANYLSQGQQQ